MKIIDLALIGVITTTLVGGWALAEHVTAPRVASLPSPTATPTTTPTPAPTPVTYERPVTVIHPTPTPLPPPPQLYFPTIQPLAVPAYTPPVLKTCHLEWTFPVNEIAKQVEVCN